MTWECEACGAESEKCYRCTECGRDLARQDPTAGDYDV